jgi:hypothetical protein
MTFFATLSLRRSRRTAGAAGTIQPPGLAVVSLPERATVVADYARVTDNC